MSKLLNEDSMKYDLNIQLFGEDPANPEEGAEGAGDGKGEEGKPTGRTPEEQAEFDKAVQKAADKTAANLKETLRKEIETELTEAQRLEKMSKDEREAEIEKQRVADLDAREKAIERKELNAEAVIQLSVEGLPTSFAKILNYESADTVAESIKVIKTSFAAEVSKAVDLKLNNGKQPDNPGTLTEEEKAWDKKYLQ